VPRLWSGRSADPAGIEVDVSLPGLPTVGIVTIFGLKQAVLGLILRSGFQKRVDPTPFANTLGVRFFSS
jgi:hypothetical protein